MNEIYELRKRLNQSEQRIALLEERLDNLSNQLLHIFEINNLKNPFH